MDKDGVWLPFQWIEAVFTFLVERLRPVWGAIEKVAGESTPGFLLIFFIFFAVFLIRGAAKSKDAGTFGSGLRHVGRIGTIATACYTGLLAFNFLFMPIIALMIGLIFLTITGQHPNISDFFAMFGNSAGAGFVSDMFVVYRSDRSILPLGFLSSSIVGVAFGCMWLVGAAFAPPISRSDPS